MITAGVSEIEDRIRRHLQEEVRCEFSGSESGRVGCVMPLEYPDGDSVVVWLRQHGSVFEVTEYGEAVAGALAHPPQDVKALEELADAICRSQGVEYAGRRVLARAELDALGEVIWRVSVAAAQIAQVTDVFRPKRRERPEREFAREVEHAFLERRLPVERQRKIEGQSGHTHRATIFVPTTDAILEPVGTGQWNKATAVYAKFGDIRDTNGFRLYSVIDDREQLPDEEGARLLNQVSDVVEWSRRDDWLAVFA